MAWGVQAVRQVVLRRPKPSEAVQSGKDGRVEWWKESCTARDEDLGVGASGELRLERVVVKQGLRRGHGLRIHVHALNISIGVKTTNVGA